MELLKINLSQVAQDKKDISTANCFPPTTYKSISLLEKNLEDLIATFPALLNLHSKNGIEIGYCTELPNRTSELLIVSRQPVLTGKKRPDLVALDELGNLHCIELKRDREDSQNRSEAFEFQAIRYAAEFSKYTSDNIIGLYTEYLGRLLKDSNQYKLLPSGLPNPRGESPAKQYVHDLYDELSAFLKDNDDKYLKGLYCHMSMHDKYLPDFAAIEAAPDDDESQEALHLMAEFGIRRFLNPPQAEANAEITKDKDYLFPQEGLAEQLSQTPSNQRIYLVAGSFEPECLAACSWLLKSGGDSQGVQVFCFQFTPYAVDDQNVLFALTRILPLPGEDELLIFKREEKSKPKASPLGIRATAIRWKGIKYGGFGNPIESRSDLRGNSECVRFFCGWLLERFETMGLSAGEINELFASAKVLRNIGFLTLLGEQDPLPSDRGAVLGGTHLLRPSPNAETAQSFRAFIFTNLSKDVIAAKLKEMVQGLNRQHADWGLRLGMIEPNDTVTWLDESSELAD